MDHMETKLESNRIEKQRIARRDLLLPSQPTVERLNALVMQLLKLQLWFCGAVVVLGSVFPGGARLLAAAVSPISRTVFLIYQSYPLRDGGPLGASFYQSVIGENFFCSVRPLVCVSDSLHWPVLAAPLALQ
jgi:hypothetical protein